MNGYVRNKTPYWRHAMKRSIGPGHKIPLDELYEQYGEKHDIEEGQTFVDWLKTVKLKDSDVWEVVFKDNKKQIVQEEELQVQTTSSSDTSQRSSRFTGSNVDPVELVNMTVREARDNLPKVTDLKTLKHAHQEARQLANKDTLTRMMKKRITELEIARR